MAKYTKNYDTIDMHNYRFDTELLEHTRIAGGLLFRRRCQLNRVNPIINKILLKGRILFKKVIYYFNNLHSVKCVKFDMPWRSSSPVMLFCIFGVNGRIASGQSQRVLMRKQVRLFAGYFRNALALQVEDLLL